MNPRALKLLGPYWFEPTAGCSDQNAIYVFAVAPAVVSLLGAGIIVADYVDPLLDTVFGLIVGDPPDEVGVVPPFRLDMAEYNVPVSYTHLTLPTIYSV